MGIIMVSYHDDKYSKYLIFSHWFAVKFDFGFWV